jgi:drug/metabolite transporter (DMT)-like permease
VRRSALLVVLAACAWGTWSLFVRPTGLSATWASTIVFAFVAIGAAPFARGEAVAQWDRRVVAMLVAFAVLDAVNVGTFFAAMTTTSIAVAVLTHSVAPLIVALLAPWIDGQRVRWAGLAAGVGLAGLALLLRPWESPAEGVVPGAVLGLASALAYAGNVFLTKRLTPRLGAFRALGWHALGAGLLLLPLALREPVEIEPSDVALLGVGAALLGIAASVSFVRGLVVVGSARAAVIALLEPLVACLVGWLVWGEPLEPLGIVGALMIVGAAAAVARGTEPEVTNATRHPPARREGERAR